MILVALLLIGAALLLQQGGDQGNGTAPVPGESNEIAPETAAVITSNYLDFINEASQLYGVRPELIIAVIAHESQGNADAVGDGGKALGLMQMHAPAAADVGVDWNTLRDPRTAILAGTHYLKLQLDHFGGDERQALIAYNQGAGVASNGADARYAAGARYADTVLSLA